MKMSILFKFILEKEWARIGGRAEGEGQSDSEPSTEPDAGALSHNPEITTRAKTKSWTPKQPSHPRAPTL